MDFIYVGQSLEPKLERKIKNYIIKICNYSKGKFEAQNPSNDEIFVKRSLSDELLDGL